MSYDPAEALAQALSGDKMASQAFIPSLCEWAFEMGNQMGRLEMQCEQMQKQLDEHRMGTASK